MILPRINKTVILNVKISNLFVCVILRHNIDYLNKWRKEEIITCWVFQKHEFGINRILELEFNNYKEFKLFKDLIKKSIHE